MNAKNLKYGEELNMEELICYFNGQYMKESEVRIALWDSGLTQGGVYDVSRTYNHVPLFWKEM